LPVCDEIDDFTLKVKVYIKDQGSIGQDAYIAMDYHFRTTFLSATVFEVIRPFIHIFAQKWLPKFFN